jgi:tetraacyldisaccharide 4'-kinase
VNTGKHDAGATGDEPQLLAAVAPTVVSRDRAAGARVAAAHGDVVVMDDGLQNPSVRKSLAIAVVDGATGIGNGRCIPAGPLRASMAAQWPLVDAVVVIGSGEAGERVAAQARAVGVPVLRATLKPPVGSSSFRGSKVLAFAGIGRPEKFFASLEEVGAVIARRRSFPDHQPYTARTIKRLLEDSETGGMIPVTTEKDMVRIRRAVDPATAARIHVLLITAEFDDPQSLDQLLSRAVRAA